MCYSIILSKSAKKFYDKANEKTKRNLERTFLTLSPEVDEKVKNVDRKRDQSNTYRRRFRPLSSCLSKTRRYSFNNSFGYKN